MATAESQMFSAERDEEARYRKVQEQRAVPLQNSKALLFAALGDDSWRVRKQAVEVLLAARPDKEVIQQLVVLMRDEDNAGLRNATAELLVRVGGEVVPVLLDHLCDPDHDLRKLVVDALGILGGPDARQGLLQALSDPDCNVAAAAAEGLGISGNEDAVPELLRHLEQNQESFFRFNALATLGRIGVAGPLPGVIRQLADQDILRRAVYECLGRIGGDLEAVELLLEGAVSHLPSIRQAAVLSLAKVLHQLDGADQETARGRLRSTKDQGLMEQLSALFDTDVQPLKKAVVAILAFMADPCGAGVLFQSLTDERLAAAAQQGIRALGEQAVVAAIEHFSKTEVSAERAAVCSCLGGYGDSRAVATIRLGLHDGCPEVRSAAAYAAVRLGDPELPVLVAALLNDADSAVREAAFTALHSCACSDRNLIASVARRMAQSMEFDQRKGAAQLFATLGEDEQVACLMKDENALVREAATRAAGTMGQSRACPHLIMALVDEESDVRIAAAEALGECADPVAVAPLRLSLKDGDSWV